MEMSQIEWETKVKLDEKRQNKNVWRNIYSSLSKLRNFLENKCQYMTVVGTLTQLSQSPEAHENLVLTEIATC